MNSLKLNSLSCSRYISSIFFLAVIFFQANLFAGEKIGTFYIDAIQLRPSWVSVESDGSNFSLSDSSFALGWKLDKKYSAYAALGSVRERNLPEYYNLPNDDKFGFFQAYAQFEGIYGRIRFGLLPLNFGYDGMIRFEERLFTRAIPYTERAFGLSDQGISFFTENSGYYTELIAHNGEIDGPSDGRIWVTGNWGFSNQQSFRAQLSLQTGYVEGSLSAGSTNTLAGVNNGETARWRNGVLFVNWFERLWSAVLQYGGGEQTQGKNTGRYETVMFSFTNTLSDFFGVGLRYEDFDPNRKLSGDRIRKTSLLLQFKDKKSNSNVLLEGTNVLEEHNKIPNDEIRLVWLLTPYTN